MQVSFVAREDDQAAVRAVTYLQNRGYKTRLQAQDEPLSPSSVALFGTSAKLRNRFLMVSAHKMVDRGVVVPEAWRRHPFLAAVNSEADLSDSGFRFALSQLAQTYGTWGPWMKDPEAPWSPDWKDGVPHVRFAEWKQSALEHTRSVSVHERLGHRTSPVFAAGQGLHVQKLVITGCALFNKPHTDVIATIPKGKRDIVLRTLASVIADTGVQDVKFVVPGSDLMQPRLRDHFHLFMFMPIADVERHLGQRVGTLGRIFGERHAHARTDTEVGQALEVSAEALRRDIVSPLSEGSGVGVEGVSWTEYIGSYLEQASAIAERYRHEAEAIYLERVRTRPSYASLHKIDPEAGLRRTISNNVFYIAEAMYLRDNPDTAIVNCEFADTFWKGLEEVLAREVWGSWRPYIGMVPQEARQPWGY